MNLVAQQLLARVLAEGRVGRSAWPGTFDAVRAQAELDPTIPETVLEHMLKRSLLVEDSSIVAMGPVGEQEYGRRNFMDVTSLFLTEPLLAVRWGQRELGSVDPSSLARATTRARRSCSAAAPGASATSTGTDGSSGSSRSTSPAGHDGRRRGRAVVDVCQAIRHVLCGDDRLAEAPDIAATAKFAQLREEYDLGDPDRNDACPRRCAVTVAVVDIRRRAREQALAHALDEAGVATMAVDDLSIGLRTRAAASDVKEAASGATTSTTPADPRRRDTRVKFGSCLARRRTVEPDARRPRSGRGRSRRRACRSARHRPRREVATGALDRRILAAQMHLVARSPP